LSDTSPPPDPEILTTIGRPLDDPDPAHHADAVSEATHWAVLAWRRHRGRTSRVRLLAVLEAVAGAMVLVGLARREEDGPERD
jgi:hypothetical protein